MSTTSLSSVQGLEDDDDGPEVSGPAPHPDDRLWRHPSEMAAMRAAPTVELPIVDIDRRTVGAALHRGLWVAAAVVVVGASALAVGALTARSSIDDASDGTRRAVGSGTVDQIDSVAVVTDADGDGALAARLHDQLVDSLPRVEAATGNGMREGSGAFVTADGHIVTSSQLVAGADYLLVWTNDGSRWQAEVVASDAFSDVAVLRIESKAIALGNFEHAAFKQDAELWAGQYAIALDHDGGSMTIGEVASLSAAAPSELPGDRSSRFDVQPGMAPGAAIVDDSGAIIGLVNASTASQATPSWMVERVVDDLIATGSTQHSFLGVAVEADAARTHVRVLDIVPGSPADRAGLRVGDVIDAVDGEAISTTASLWTLLQRRAPGDAVSLAVTRNGERRLVTAQLSALGE